MKTNRMLMSVAALALLAASPALAEGANKDANAGANTQINTPVGSASVGAQANATVSAIDTNGDGTISKEEMAAAESKGIDVQQFAQLDTNRDGKLTAAELKASGKVRSTNQ